MNILITNIGRRGYLVEFIKEEKSFNGKIYVSDSDKSASGLYGNVDKSFILPNPIDDEDYYIERLLKLCLEYEINLIVPIIDPEIYILSKHKNIFSEKGITILVSDIDTLEICYSKINMNTFLAKNGFNVVKTYSDIEKFKSDLLDNKIEFPVFMKPTYGSGSINTGCVNSYEELVAFYKPGMIIQEYLDGQEYGVDTFVDSYGTPVRVVVKEKLLMRSGETDKAITVEREDIQDVLIKLANKLKPLGPFDSDVVETKNGLYVIDINPRFGGGYPATHMAGVSFIELLTKIENNEKIEPLFNNYTIGQLTMKDVGLKTVNINYETYKQM